jgi:hypothetical protein
MDENSDASAWPDADEFIEARRDGGHVRVGAQEQRAAVDCDFQSQHVSPPRPFAPSVCDNRRLFWCTLACKWNHTVRLIAS